MAGRPRVWTDPAQAEWLVENVERYASLTQVKGTLSRRFYEAFTAHFPERQGVGMTAWRQWAGDVLSRSAIPPSPMDDITDKLLELHAPATLITSDYQIPYLDAEAVRFAFDLGLELGCTEHVINGDLYDFANLSKFDPSLHGHRMEAGEELLMGGAVVRESRRRFAHTTFVPGNHEWRLFLRRLSAQLNDDQIKEILAPGADVSYTPLSYVHLNDCIRITHPGSASIVPGAVARALAERHHMNVVVAHGHGIGYARSYGGHYWCIESGGLFDSNRMDYGMVVDKRRPASNQGFVVIDGVTPYLVDLAVADRDSWLHWAEGARTRREKAEKETA